MRLFQIIFNPTSAAELAKMPKELQLQILGEFRGLPQQVMNTELGDFGKLERAGGSILGGDPAKYRQGSVFPAPGWGLYSTAEDLLHLYRMMLDGGVYQGKRYLSPFSVYLMTEPHTVGIHPVGWMRGADYGLAWEVVTDPLGELAGHRKGTYGHGGAFGTQGWIDPASGTISILLIQRADGATESLRNVFLTMAEATAGK